MNVSMNSLSAAPRKWVVEKSAVEPDPLRRWATAAAPSLAARVESFVQPEVRAVYAQSLREAHYASMEEKLKNFKGAAAPPRHIGAVAGYGGHIPHAKGVIGVSRKRVMEICSEMGNK